MTGLAYFHWGALLLSIISAVLFRYRLLPERILLGLVAVGFMAFVLVSIIVLIALVVKGSFNAWFVGSLLSIVGVVFMVVRAAQLPVVNDVSTSADLKFSYAQTLRASHHHSLDGVSSHIVSSNLIMGDRCPELYAKALGVGKALGWEITYESPKQGVFEAYDRTKLLRFVDDIVVRVKSDQACTVDMRSASRLGKSDFGANAKRIQQFMQALEKDQS